MTTATNSTIDDAAECAANWAEMVRAYAALEAEHAAEQRLHELSEQAGEDYPDSPRPVGALLDARDDLAHADAPTWAALGVHAQIYIDSNEDDGWCEKITIGSPTYWIAKIIDGSATIDMKSGPAHDMAVLELLGSVESCAHAFVHHRDGYQNWGCNPAGLSWNVDLITCMQESARRLAHEPRYAGYFSAIFGAVWFSKDPAQTEAA